MEKNPISETSPSPPTPRRRLSPAERLPLIHEAAFEEFAAEGYAAARMEAVASRAGVAKGLLYHYFPGGKADLFKTVALGCVQPLFEDAEKLIHGFTGPRLVLLRQLIDIAYGNLVANPRERVLLKLLISEGDRFPDLTDFYHAEVIARGDALVRIIVQSGIESGEFDPAIAAWPQQLLIGPVVLASTWRLLFADRHPLDLAALRDAHYALLVAGLSRRS
jgi:AcrR family transcriptional regulator